MEFKELEGDCEGSKLFETTDHHIYRHNKAGTPYLSCYSRAITKKAIIRNPTLLWNLFHTIHKV